MKNQINSILLIAAVCLSGISIVLHYIDKPKVRKVGYVHNDKLLSGFDGFKEGKEELKAKMEVWQANLDTLTTNFNRDAQSYTGTREKLSAKERQLTEQILSRQEKDVRVYKNTVEQKALEEEQKINQSMLNQINAYLKEYGQENDYSYIFGVTDNGSILYGNTDEDLTEKVLDYINKKYQGAN